MCLQNAILFILQTVSTRRWSWVVVPPAVSRPVTQIHSRNVGKPARTVWLSSTSTTRETAASSKRGRASTRKTSTSSRGTAIKFQMTLVCSNWIHSVSIPFFYELFLRIQSVDFKMGKVISSYLDKTMHCELSVKVHPFICASIVIKL